jgi:hypothetical protein
VISCLLTCDRWHILKEVTKKKPIVADQIMFKLVGVPSTFTTHMFSLKTAIYCCLDLFRFILVSTYMLQKGWTICWRSLYQPFAFSSRFCLFSSAFELFFCSRLVRVLFAFTQRRVAYAFPSIPLWTSILYLLPSWKMCVPFSIQPMCPLLYLTWCHLAVDSRGGLWQTCFSDNSSQTYQIFQVIMRLCLNFAAIVQPCCRDTFLSPLLASASRRRPRDSGDMEDFSSGAGGRARN